MNFGEAIIEAREGKKIRRAGWHNTDKFVVFMPETHIEHDLVNQRTQAHIPMGRGLHVGGYFVFVGLREVGDMYVDWQPGWLASQPDMLAIDWEAV